MNTVALRPSILLRMLLVLALTLVLLIPATMVESTIKERSVRRTAAVAEISNTWGTSQLLTGPALTIPLRRTVTDEKGRSSTVVEQLHIFPDSLSVKGDLTTEVRQRGLYEAVLYNGRLTVSGSFDLNDIPQFQLPGRVPQWDDARISLGITDLRGIRQDVVMKWNGKVVPARPGLRSQEIATTGVTFAPGVEPKTLQYQFALTLDLNGTSDLLFTPSGRRTDVTLRSSWGDPSFVGAFLPNHRTVDDTGFTAHWAVLELNRNLSHSRIGGAPEEKATAFGVRLLQTADEYQQTLRTAKYAILIITLTFLAFFMSEVLVRELFHPVHYALVGLALVLFFLLVLALSEHTGFVPAYAVSALSVVLLVGLYTRAIAARTQTSYVVAGVQSCVYAFLFVVLQIEDYALLAGSLGLLVSLGTVMYLTRRVDWFALGVGTKETVYGSQETDHQESEGISLT